jgi:hypothetical protein
MADVNWLAVLVAAVAHFVLGGVWYSPMLFAKPFMRGMGKSEEELRSGAKPSAFQFGGAFLGGLLKSASLALILAWIGDPGVAESIAVGALLGVGIHGAADVTNALFEGRHRNLVLIGIGYDTVGLALAGAIVAAMG